MVGNPANTNALIAMKNAPDLDPRNFTAMMRLDHNRAIAQLAEKTGVLNTDIQRVIIWGNHSSTQYPDLDHAESQGRLRGADILPARIGWNANSSPPCSSAAPRSSKRAAHRRPHAAASAAIDHMRDWALGSDHNDWVTMSMPSDGSYGIKPGVIYGFPRHLQTRPYEIVQGLAINDFSRARMDATDKELREERAGVEHLFAKTDPEAKFA